MEETEASSDDRYEVLETLGQNDYLSVYRAWDRRIRRPVAIMELHPRFFTTDEHCKRVWSQVLESADIAHPGFVRLYEVDQGRTWIVAELMEQNFRDRAAGPGISEGEARYLLWAALEALEYLHGRNLLHGDIRPANLLLDASGRLRLSYPLGLRLGGEVPRRIQNQKYLAPELINSAAAEPGPATDLYCLGFSVYELLVGGKFDGLLGLSPTKTRDGGESVNWLRWVSSEESQLPPIKSILPGLADDVATLIHRLVAKPIQERPRSATEARNLLNSASLLTELPRTSEPESKAGRNAPVAAAAALPRTGIRSSNMVKPDRVTPSNRLIKQVPNGVVWGVVLSAAVVMGLLLRPGEPADPAPVSVNQASVPKHTSEEPPVSPPAKVENHPIKQEEVTAAEAANPVQASILNGTWKWTNANQEGAVTLQVDKNGKLTGTLKLPSGREAVIEDAEFTDGELRFATTVEHIGTGQLARSLFQGKVVGDTIRGTIETDRGDAKPISGAWEAHRD